MTRCYTSSKQEALVLRNRTYSLLSILSQITVAYASLVVGVEPMITESARFVERQANSICGFYSDDAGLRLASSITCNYDMPCVRYTNTYPEIVYCSGSGEPVVTTAYDYDYWPSDGCSLGEVCCSTDLPQAGEYIWDQGATVAFACFGEGTSTVYATTKVEDINTTPNINPVSTVNTDVPNPVTTANPPNSTNVSPFHQGLSTGGKIAAIVAPIVTAISTVSAIVLYRKQKDKKKSEVAINGNHGTTRHPS